MSRKSMSPAEIEELRRTAQLHLLATTAMVTDEVGWIPAGPCSLGVAYLDAEHGGIIIWFRQSRHGC